MKAQLTALLTFFIIFNSCSSTTTISETEAFKNKRITADIPADSSFKKTISPYKITLDKTMNSKIAHTNYYLDKSGDNSSLGNLLADFTLEGARDWTTDKGYAVDGAIINIGGIRSTIGKGDILLKHVYEVMPFENELVIVKLSGVDMKGIFDYYLEKQKNNPVANFKISIKNNEIIEALVNNQPVELDKYYYIATSDYLVNGGDGMDFFTKGEVIPTGVKLREVYINKFKEMGEIVAPKDIRLQFIKTP